MLSGGGFVSDAYVFTGSDGQVAPSCPYATAPPRANPSGMNGPISYEFARLGSAAYEGLCITRRNPALVAPGIRRGRHP